MGRLHICAPPPRSHPAAGSRAFIHMLEGNTQRPLARLRLGCGLQRSQSAPEAREAPAALVAAEDAPHGAGCQDSGPVEGSCDLLHLQPDRRSWNPSARFRGFFSLKGYDWLLRGSAPPPGLRCSNKRSGSRARCRRP